MSLAWGVVWCASHCDMQARLELTGVRSFSVTSQSPAEKNKGHDMGEAKPFLWESLSYGTPLRCSCEIRFLESFHGNAEPRTTCI